MPDNFAAWTLSARRELQSHPLAGQAQACGRLTKGGWARGPDGTYRDHWYSPCRKNPSHASSLCSGPCSSFSIVPREIHNLCVSSLQFFHCVVVKKLQERVAPLVLLCRIEKQLHSRIVRVILAQGSCPMLQILDTCPHREKTGTMRLFFQKTTVCTCHPNPVIVGRRAKDA